MCIMVRAWSLCLWVWEGRATCWPLRGFAIFDSACMQSAMRSLTLSLTVELALRLVVGTPQQICM